MDKIKNIVNPGSKKDDDVMYGSGVSDDPVHSGTTETHSGQGDHLSNTPAGGNDPLSSSTNPTSGIAHGSTPGKDPLSTSTNPTGSSQYDTGSSSHGTHGLKEPYASRMPGAFEDDAASTASVRSGIPGQATHTGPGITSTNDSNLTSKHHPHEPASAGTGLTGTSRNVNPESSSLTGNQYPNRSVGRSDIGDHPTGSSHTGRDTSLGAGVGAVGAGTAIHDTQRSAQRDDYAPETGRSFPLSGSSNTMADSDHRSEHSGAYPTGNATTAGPHSSNLANKADPRVDSDLDGSRTAGTSGRDSGIGPTAGSTHQGSVGRDAALGANTGVVAGGVPQGVLGYGPESWAHDHGKHGHQFGGDPCGPGATTASGPHFVSGPHATDTANRLDPHVADGVGGTTGTTHHQAHHGHQPEGTTLAGIPGGASQGTNGGSRDYPGTSMGNTTASGLGSSTEGTASSSTGPAPSSAGPHKSDMVNKLDPRVDSDLSKQHGGTDTTGSGIPTSTTGSSDPRSSHDTSHHRGEGAILGGGSLAGATAYEGEKHRHRNEPSITGTTSGTTSSADPHSSSILDPRVGSTRSDLHNSTTSAGSNRDHHLGRDAGLGAGAAGLVHEAERRHDQPTKSTDTPSGPTTGGYNSAHAPSGYDHAGNGLAGSSQQPAASKDHHYGRDAALGAGVGAAAYETEKHHGRDHPAVASTPQGQLAGSGHQHEALHSSPDRSHQTGREHDVGRDVIPGRPGHANEHSLQDPAHHSHRREEEALAGGAAAGGLAHHERSKDEKALQKDHAKEERALEKEHAKELKQHDKALAKEEKASEKDQKAHEKERAKHLAAIEKDQKKHEHDKHKDDKHKHEHEHEHDGEKKKGGLLGFLHRDKPDKELKEEEAARKASQNAAHRPEDEGLPAGSGIGNYDPLAGEHGSQSGVHDTPIGTGITTHEAYGTHEGHNKLHKDPPAKVLEARGQEYQGHGSVS